MLNVMLPNDITDICCDYWIIDYRRGPADLHYSVHRRRISELSGDSGDSGEHKDPKLRKVLFNENEKNEAFRQHHSSALCMLTINMLN
jgi:hypothetical protein